MDNYSDPHKYSTPHMEQMNRRPLLTGIGIASAMILAIGMIVPHTASASDIFCAPTVFCTGTNGNDKMFADPGGSVMAGLLGDDKMIGSKNSGNAIFGEGDDCAPVGDGGKDAIVGGAKGDLLFGCAGSDTMTGGDGDDKILHNEGQHPTNSDGSKDRIDCGPGNDEAWINVSVDHDVAIGCETVHSG